MAIASIASLNASSSARPASSSGSIGSTVLGQNDFMKLLMTQMQNQNPMDPTNSAEFMSQLAQFASLQGITQLNQNFANLLTLQSLNQGTSLIGKPITYTDSGGRTASGTVGSVSMVGGQVQLVVNGTNVSLSQIQSVQAAPRTSANAGNTTNPITNS